MTTGPRMADLTADQVRIAASPELRTASEMLAGYAAGNLSPLDVMEATLARANSIGSALNAFLTVDADGALEAARNAEVELSREGIRPDRPLLGLPVSVKDLTATAGLRTTRGALRLSGHIPTSDAPAVARIRRAGGIVFAKSNTSEAGWKGDAGNRLLGSTANPWGRSRSSGGSSGGAAAAVAAGIGPLATGTDSAGSIRIPAAFCGVVGLKPTHGLVPYVPPSVDRLAHLGPLARSTADAALLLGVIAGMDPRDPSSAPAPPGLTQGLDHCPHLRIGLSTDLGFGQPTAESVATVRSAADSFAQLGHDVVELGSGIADPYPVLDTIWAAAEAGGYEDLVPHLDQLEPGYLRMIQRGRGLSAAALVRAEEARARLCADLESMTSDCDLLLTPTMPDTAFELGQPGPGGVEDLTWSPFTYPFNLTGQPAISLPIAIARDGLPLSIQLVGRRFEDALVLRAAAALEAECEWDAGFPDLWSRMED
jgi:aspartyl-tRNA(Asn)/glutamyl-tRNA(Gln) amidotransferase subunit A